MYFSEVKKCNCDRSVGISESDYPNYPAGAFGVLMMPAPVIPTSHSRLLG